MNILITSAASALASALADALAGEHRVRLTDLADVGTPHEFVRCNLDDGEETDRLVAGVDAVVHLAEPPPAFFEGVEDGDALWVDFHTRRTYNLLLAAREAGVSRCVYASTLGLFGTLDENWDVTETWRPRPTVDAAMLSRHLGEFVCREFGREGRISVCCLRLGTVGADAGDPMRLSMEDAVEAFGCALRADARPWEVFHVQSEFPGARFGVGRAKQALGFVPGGAR